MGGPDRPSPTKAKTKHANAPPSDFRAGGLSPDPRLGQSRPQSTYRHRTDPGTTNTPALPRPLLCEVVKPLPKREVVADPPELLRLIKPSPKRCVVVVAPLESRLIVPLPKRLVVTVGLPRSR
jgi:hypothetical protein